MTTAHSLPSIIYLHNRNIKDGNELHEVFSHFNGHEQNTLLLLGKSWTISPFILSYHN